MNRFFILFLVLFVFGGQETVDGIAAIVEEEFILKNEVLQQVFYIASAQKIDLYNNKKVLESLYESTLNQMVDGLILYDIAKKDTTLIIDEFLVEEKVQEEISRQVDLVGSVKDLEKTYGEPLSRIRAKLRKELKKTFLIEQLKGSLYPLSSPSPKDIQSFYEEYKDSLPLLPSRVDFSVLEWPVSFQKQKEDSIVVFLNKIRNSFLLGEDFSSLAFDYSDDLVSGKKGGSLGYTSRGTLFPEYESAAYGLEVGEVSFPFVSPIGYHLVFLEARLGEKIKTSHILKKVSIDDNDTQSSLSSFKFFLGENNVYNSVDTFDSLCVHFNPSEADFQGVFFGFPVSDLPSFLSDTKVDSFGFSSFITRNDKIYLARFFGSDKEGPVSLENYYLNLYDLTQNRILYNKITNLINTHSKKIHIQKFY